MVTVLNRLENATTLNDEIVELQSEMENRLHILFIGRSVDAYENLNEQEGVSVIFKTNMQEALSYLQGDSVPDAVISEMYVSGGEGLDLFRWMRERPVYNKSSFILISHEFKEELYKEAFHCKVDDYFVLPLPDGNIIVERIKFLAQHKQQQTGKEKEAPVIPEGEYQMPLSKRLFDVAAASAALIALSPVLLLTMLAIRLESKGKVYYISKRVGREPFDFYKFRSMRVGADKELNQLAKEKNQYNTESQKSGIDFSTPCPRCTKLSNGARCSSIMHVGTHQICEYWYNIQKKEIAKSKSAFIKISDDPRITKVGKFIRNTSIDELPQLINVLKGDMSIVGNRPLPVYEAELLTLGHQAKRFLAPPGITGLWQVELRGKGGVMSEEERMNLDNEYADHFINGKYSFWYDFKLILRTIPALFQKDTV